MSVLFADLVGFTALSESRDAEQTRELLSRYFELARTLITRYGGTVEKFIGDAVMAVWGTPVATESDAERAVRAALDLVASIPELDPGLQAQGRGADRGGGGDDRRRRARAWSPATWSTPPRASSRRPSPARCWSARRRAGRPSQAIVYEAAGEHELKGKSEPVALWRALRVVSGVGGALKSAGLEAPFVGRSRELKLIKDLFHGCAQDGGRTWCR